MPRVNKRKVTSEQQRAAGASSSRKGLSCPNNDQRVFFLPLDVLALAFFDAPLEAGAFFAAGFAAAFASFGALAGAAFGASPAGAERTAGFGASNRIPARLAALRYVS